MARRFRAFLVVAVTLTAAAVPAAGAGIPARSATSSFEGSCAIVGNAVLAHPMGLVPRQSSFRFIGEGRCQGTLNGRVLPHVGAPVRLVSSGPRQVHSCGLGVDLGISFDLTFHPDTKRERTIVGDGHILDVVRGQYSLVRGQWSGFAAAVNTLQGHMETLRRCAAGTLRGGTVGLQVDTLTPLVSEDPRT